MVIVVSVVAYLISLINEVIEKVAEGRIGIPTPSIDTEAANKRSPRADDYS